MYPSSRPKRPLGNNNSSLAYGISDNRRNKSSVGSTKHLLKPERVSHLHRCPNHDCDDVLNANAPKMQAAAGVVGAWCLNTKCNTCSIHIWTMHVLKAWLKARREGGYTKLKVGQLRERVYHLMDRVEGPPAIRPPLYAKLSDVINLVIEMMDMICLLMMDNVTGEMCVRAEVLVKLFLSRVDVVEYGMFHHLGKYVPMWIKNQTSWEF
jgi:hypothetical protein